MLTTIRYTLVQVERYKYRQAYRIAIFLELDFSHNLIEQMIKAARERLHQTKTPFTIPPKQECTDGSLSLFMRFAGEQMRRLGYVLE